jgi:hypothetical protein
MKLLAPQISKARVAEEQLLEVLYIDINIQGNPKTQEKDFFWRLEAPSI